MFAHGVHVIHGVHDVGTSRDLSLLEALPQAQPATT